MGLDKHSLPLTEEVNPSTTDLDLLGTQDLLHRINDEDRRAAWAVEREIDVIATAVDEIANRLRAGGKLHYFGAGTSGRIAVLDAAEIPPTFSTYDLVVAHMAGGHDAMARSVEAAEDDAAAGWREVAESNIGSADVVVGVSASGAAAYVLRAIEAAKTAGALTMCITNSTDTALTRLVHIPIVLRTGPEVIAGSTRMKAGSAQKMALTMISTAVMVKLGKVYGNLMVDLHPSNTKLRDRAERLACQLSGATPDAARSALQRSGYRVKLAVVMLRRGCDPSAAEALLVQANGDLRKALSGAAAAGG
ncbi:MAG: N-acetylmuramic acid 6-phosphate etherase [Candidatus Eremiobacteraeota bacterium]|nr:N-acetylmuramic acid 6-phosphate etherase [Candidatus Eremiobacteraeota bacterium]